MFAFNKEPREALRLSTGSNGHSGYPGQEDFFVPASYILYLSDFCRFLLCTCGWERRGWRRGGG
jgi:hypothetical protein